MIFLVPLGSTTTFADGMNVPSMRTCDTPGAKPEPKICTPGRSLVEASVACGTRALGMPPMAPGPGLGGVGTITSVISADFMMFAGAAVGSAVRLITWMTPLPDCTTKAWLVAGSTATPPHKVSEPVVPFVTGMLTEPVVPDGILTKA